MNSIFIEAVNRGIENKNLSLRGLARKTGLDVSFISKILSGKRNPPSREEDIRKIADVLDLNPEKLILRAGRIPSSLSRLFSNEDFLDSLITGKVFSPPAASHSDETPKSGLEDELL